MGRVLSGCKVSGVILDRRGKLKAGAVGQKKEHKGQGQDAGGAYGIGEETADHCAGSCRACHAMAQAVAIEALKKTMIVLSR